MVALVSLADFLMEPPHACADHVVEQRSENGRTLIGYVCRLCTKVTVRDPRREHECQVCTRAFKSAAPMEKATCSPACLHELQRAWGFMTALRLQPRKGSHVPRI